VTLIGGVLFLLIATVIGRAMLPQRQRLVRSRWEELALSYLLGCTAVMVGLTAGLAAGISFHLLFFLPIAAAFGCGYLIWKGKESPQDFAANLFSRWTTTTLVLLAVGSIAATLALPLNEFDPIYHFGYRGQVLLYDGSATSEAITGMIHPDGYGRMVTHPNYPFGVPILEAWVAKIGGWHPRWVQIPLAFWTACLPLVVAFGLRPRGARTATFGALVAAVTPMLYGADFLMNGWDSLSRAGLAGEMMLGGGGDVGIACLLTLSLSLWLRRASLEGVHLVALSALSLAGTGHLKNEGLGLAGCVVLALLLGALLPKPSQAKKQLLPIAQLCGFLVLMLGPWLFLRAQLPAIDENYTERLTLSNVVHFWSAEELEDRSPQAAAGKTDDLESSGKRRNLVATAFLEEFADWRSWGILWLLFFCALPVTRRRLADVDLRQLCLLVLGATTLYFLILLVTPWNFPSLRDKGIPERLLVHLVGVMALAVGTALSLGEAETKEA